MKREAKDWIVQYRGILFFLLILAILAGLVLFQALRPRSLPPILDLLTPAPSPQPTATPHPLRVYVSGAVQHPDVYFLAPDSIIRDALQAAGGATSDADLDRINLAQTLGDGQHVYVPRHGEEALSVPSLPQRGGEQKVNINTADAALLESLPGIGPVIAQRIIDYRQSHGPFESVDDLLEVPGVGPSTLDKIRDSITTR